MGGAGKTTGADMLRGGVLALALIAAAGCSPIYRNHGFVPAQDELLALEPGVDTRDSVIEAVGRPSASGVAGDQALYYVASRFRRVGPLAPQEIERQVVALSFDAGGTLRNIERYGLEDGRVVALEREITDNNLRDTTFLRQLLGNLGNFDAGQLLGGDE